METDISGKTRLLIAEDEKVILQSVVQALNQQPDLIVVSAVTSGEEAIAAAKTTEIDVALLDIEMETLNAGIYAAGIIHHYCPKTKIIYLTAHDSDDMIITAMATGASDYFVKWHTYEPLFEHIRMVVNGTPMMDEKIQNVLLNEYSRLHQSEESLLMFLGQLATLTPTEKEMIYYLLQGYNLRQISDFRNVTLETSKTQAKSIRKKFKVEFTNDVVKIIRKMRLEYLFEPMMY